MAKQSNDHEVEIRGFLPTEQFEELNNLLKDKIVEIQEQDNIYFNDIPIQIRKVREDVTLTAKSGKLGDENRREIKGWRHVQLWIF